MNNGTQREWFWRVDEGEIWISRQSIYTIFIRPFYEITVSTAPHIIINKPYCARPNIFRHNYFEGKHVLIPDEVLNLIEVWKLSPGFGGYESLSSFLSASYD